MYILQCPKCGKLYSIDEQRADRGENPDLSCMNCEQVVPSHIQKLLKTLNRAIADANAFGWQVYRVPDDSIAESTVTFRAKPVE